MEYLVLGFFTGLSLILAIGAQNIFVIEQGLKKQYVFLVCLICSLSDLLLIFFGIFKDYKTAVGTSLASLLLPIGIVAVYFYSKENFYYQVKQIHNKYK